MQHYILICSLFVFFSCNHRLNFFPHTSLKDFDQWLILIDNQQNNIRFIIFSDLDATGKPPSGILVGNLAWLGSYEECTKYVPDAHYCMAFFDTPIQPLTKVRMLSPLIWLPSMFVMELEKYIVTCEWQNHSLVSNKYVSHYLCSIISSHFKC